METEIILLTTIAPDWFDSKLFRNALYSSRLIERKMKKNPDSVKQADLKQSSETIKIAKESELSVEEIEKLYLAEQKKLLSDSRESNTTPKNNYCH